jgi:hypothetical protein
MRETVIVAAMTAVITAIISIWATNVIFAHSKAPDAALASTAVDLMQMINEARSVCG